jgi:hypothetical protein
MNRTCLDAIDLPDCESDRGNMQSSIGRLCHVIGKTAWAYGDDEPAQAATHEHFVPERVAAFIGPHEGILTEQVWIYAALGSDNRDRLRITIDDRLEGRTEIQAEIPCA